jgi:hypothetical protein
MKKLLLLPLAVLALTSCSDDEENNDDVIGGTTNGPITLTFNFNGIDSDLLAGPTSYGANLYDGYEATEPTDPKRFYSATITINDSIAITGGINPGEPTAWSAGNDYNFWNGGIAFSKWNELTSEDWGDYTNQCSSYPSANGDVFAVIYQSASNPMPTLTFADGKAYTISLAQVANTAYAYNVIVNGNGYASSLADTDGWFKIQAWGFDANGDATNGGEPVEFYLADYTTASSAGVLESWGNWDLSALGAVNSVAFSFEGSDSSSYGLNTPAYAALRSLTLKW